MALGVTPLRVGQESYWLEQIARDACEYYSGKGESPGRWAGSLAELVAGERPRRDLQAVLSSRGKVGVATVERVWRTVLERNPAELYGEGYAEARKHAGRRVDARVMSFDRACDDRRPARPRGTPSGTDSASRARSRRLRRRR